MYWLFYHVMFFLVSFDLCWFKVCFIKDLDCNSWLFCSHLLDQSSSIPLFWAYVCPCMWDELPEYTTQMGIDILSNLPVCIFWLGHPAHLYLRLILLCVKLILPFWCCLVILPVSLFVFFIVSIVFSIWYIFGVDHTGCSFPCLVLLSGTLVRQAWWW